MSNTKTIELSDEDRADVRRELRECVKDKYLAARIHKKFGREREAAFNLARAQRVAELAALFAAMLLGCSAVHEQGELEGPPLYVHLCDAMPAADKEAWGKAAGELNIEHGEPVLWVGHGPPIGCSTVDVCPGRANTVGDNGCTVFLRYVDASVARDGLLAALEVVR